MNGIERAKTDQGWAVSARDTDSATGPRPPDRLGVVAVAFGRHDRTDPWLRIDDYGVSELSSWLARP